MMLKWLVNLVDRMNMFVPKLPPWVEPKWLKGKMRITRVS